MSKEYSKLRKEAQHKRKYDNKNVEKHQMASSNIPTYVIAQSSQNYRNEQTSSTPYYFSTTERTITTIPPEMTTKYVPFSYKIFNPETNKYSKISFTTTKINSNYESSNYHPIFDPKLKSTTLTTLTEKNEITKEKPKPTIEPPHKLEDKFKHLEGPQSINQKTESKSQEIKRFGIKIKPEEQKIFEPTHRRKIPNFETKPTPPQKLSRPIYDPTIFEESKMRLQQENLKHHKPVFDPNKLEINWRYTSPTLEAENRNFPSETLNDERPIYKNQTGSKIIKIQNNKPIYETQNSARSDLAKENLESINSQDDLKSRLEQLLEALNIETTTLKQKFEIKRPVFEPLNIEQNHELKRPIYDPNNFKSNQQNRYRRPIFDPSRLEEAIRIENLRDRNKKRPIMISENEFGQKFVEKRPIFIGENKETNAFSQKNSNDTRPIFTTKPKFGEKRPEIQATTFSSDVVTNNFTTQNIQNLQTNTQIKPNQSNLDKNIQTDNNKSNLLNSQIKNTTPKNLLTTEPQLFQTFQKLRIHIPNLDPNHLTTLPPIRRIDYITRRPIFNPTKQKRPTFETRNLEEYLSPITSEENSQSSQIFRRRYEDTTINDSKTERNNRRIDDATEVNTETTETETTEMTTLEITTEEATTTDEMDLTTETEEILNITTEISNTTECTETTSYNFSSNAEEKIDTTELSTYEPETTTILMTTEEVATEIDATATVSPLKKIPEEIEALLNITSSKKDQDYEYDYNEPTLPPSLPNLR